MVRQYASFVVRCWHLATGDQRIRIEHLQSGEAVQVASLAEALAWLEARSAGTDDSGEPRSTLPDQHGPRTP